MMNKIFFHIAKIGDYQKITDEIFSYIIDSNILNDSELYLSIVGVGEFNIPDIDYEIIYENDDVKVGEFPTLSKIKELSNNDVFNVLYIHTKGVSTPYNECINDWRKYMLYFNVLRYENCLEILNRYDTCGVDLRYDPVIHYSGNFWWSKSDHIKKLPIFSEMEIVLTERHKCEFWICSVIGDFYSMHDSGINQYERHLNRYEENKYKK